MPATSAAAVTGELLDIVDPDNQPPPPSAADAIVIAPLAASTGAVESPTTVPTAPPTMPSAASPAPGVAAVTGVDAEVAGSQVSAETVQFGREAVRADAAPAEAPVKKKTLELRGDEPLQPTGKLGAAIAKPSPGLDISSLPNVFRRKRRVQARKVRRVIRHIDPWSVLTFSVLFHLCVFAALLLASVLVWNAAQAAGTIENLEAFILELGDYETFEVKGEVVFRAAVAIAGILTLASSVLLVLFTVVFNLISDLVGGIRVTVIEEETIRVRRKKQTA